MRSTLFCIQIHKKIFFSLNVLCTFAAKCAMIRLRQLAIYGVECFEGLAWKNFASYLQGGKKQKGNSNARAGVCLSFDYNLCGTSPVVVGAEREAFSALTSAAFRAGKVSNEKHRLMLVKA
jgi:hypothetical protein